MKSHVLPWLFSYREHNQIHTAKASHRPLRFGPLPHWVFQVNIVTSMWCSKLHENLLKEWPITYRYILIRYMYCKIIYLRGKWISLTPLISCWGKPLSHIDYWNFVVWYYINRKLLNMEDFKILLTDMSHISSILSDWILPFNK